MLLQSGFMAARTSPGREASRHAGSCCSEATFTGVLHAEKHFYFVKRYTQVDEAFEMRRYATTFLPLLLVTACIAQKLLDLEECKDKSPGFKNVTISPCDADPCVLKRGENYNVTFYAEAPESSDFVMVTTVDEQQTEVTSIQSAHSISCHFLDVPCNVTKGEVFRGSMTLRLFAAFAPGNVTHKLTVSGGSATFACGVTTVTVQ